jgi:hypothetical protein
MAPTSRVMAASLGKMATTLVRRLISAFSVQPLQRVGAVDLQPVREGVHVRQHLVFGVVHHLGQLGHGLAELVGHDAPLLARRLGRLLGEGRGNPYTASSSRMARSRMS